MKIAVLGQGISGTTITFQLIKEGFHPVIFDQINPNSPSRVAAGIWNPVTFRRPSLSWNAEKFIESLGPTYKGAEIFSNSKFYYPMSYLRLFSSAEEQNNWFSKAADEPFSNFMSNTLYKGILDREIQNRHGGAELFHAGYVDTNKMIDDFRKELKKRNVLREVNIGQSQVSFGKNIQIRHSNQTEEFDAIIFANGLHIRDFLPFEDLPFQPVKGEVLTIKCSSINTEKILSKGFFMLPVGDNTFKIGATYSNSDLTTDLTERGKSELIDKLKGLIGDTEFEIVDHKAGIRPAIKGRRPVIGPHPHYENAFAFSGMGSKAILMAPLLAEQLVDHIENKSQIDPEVDVKRFL
jgi:glycine/D-amino acid oxidase-like deaminating enzyme